MPLSVTVGRGDSCFLQKHLTYHAATLMNNDPHTWTTYRPINLTIHAPPKYKPSRGPANSICVNGSVEGVSTAAATTAPTTTNLQIESIWSPETNPTCPSNSWITGTWNRIPWKCIKIKRSIMRFCSYHSSLYLYIYSQIGIVVPSSDNSNRFLLDSNAAFMCDMFIC